MSVYKQRLIDEAKEIANKYVLSKERTNLLVRRVLREYYRQVDTSDIITKQDIENMLKNI